ncbi:hypothetical protein CSB37_03530 [bacterium DOLZORAL124_38_8]|nr:MAG: hypothetical protein CSB37_03530 [bacterium DOLZORAL124_38_8]
MENKLNTFLDQKREELNTKGKTSLAIKVIASAPKNLWHELLPTEPPTVKIKIKAKPENGKANTVIEKFISKYFKAHATIQTGHTSSHKIISLKK